MNLTCFEAVLAFFGVASIVVGSLADRLTEHVLRKIQATSTEHSRTERRNQ